MLAAVSFSTSSQAQETGTDSTVRYPSEYFQEWAPTTAQDMLNRIPGVNVGGGGGPGGPGGPGGGGRGGGGGGRGLGGGGGDQILIDGKRMAGKDNQASSTLGRISASQVNYIEIIRGTSGALDVRGSSQVINVVLFEALDTTSISYQLTVDRYLDSQVEPGGSLSYSGQSGALTYLFSAQAQPRYDHYVSKETSRLGDWSFNDKVREERIRDQTAYTYSTNLGYSISENSSVRLNGMYSQEDASTDLMRWTTNLRTTPNTLSIEREDTPIKEDGWEIGGDYEYNFNNGHRFKILLITNEDNESSVRERYAVLNGGAEDKNRFLATDSITTEDIVRSSYTMDLVDGQDLEFGVERAKTVLDSSLRLGLKSINGVPSADFGGLVPQSVSNANSTVQEIRYEPFAVHNWQISSRMSLETSVIYEMSEITQSGDVSNQRDFSFVKPKVDWRFDVTPSFQINWTADKSVRQLSFSDFVAASDNQDNDRNTQAGNANLKQEQVMRTELGFEYRLPDDIGVVDGDVFWAKHTDVIDRLDVSPSPTNLVSVNGNIGDGINYGMTLNASIRMRMINMPNLLVTTNFTVQDSKIEDPFLGIDRRFANSDRGRFTLGFRHDIPSLRVNYGLTWNNRFDGNRKTYDIDDIEMTAGDPNVQAFVEFSAFNGITFRLDARNATNNLQCRERHRYLGPITSGIIQEYEDQCGGSGRTVSFRVNGTF
ncbi:MAG: TonB-dependent receptor [Gammaproteobacteria bacterium]|nr:TonB-dependent receptor [Gammaproteobacteria bacterium]MDP2142055.1 TonB-dependent receptor [Gammaproteobacteria bacterium]MDP2348366.1 TonB-dependent receptor [Gammaproteobacteria bacterium]